jgi:hypothetical protein
LLEIEFQTGTDVVSPLEPGDITDILLLWVTVILGLEKVARPRSAKPSIAILGQPPSRSFELWSPGMPRKVQPRFWSSRVWRVDASLREYP